MDDIFAATAQLAKQEQESFENILALFYSFLTDLLENPLRPKSSLPRNPDLRREVETLGKKVDWAWVTAGYARPRRAGRPDCAAIWDANWVWTR